MACRCFSRIPKLEVSFPTLVDSGTYLYAYNMAHIYSRQNPNDGNDEFVVDDGGGSFWWTKVSHLHSRDAEYAYVCSERGDYSLGDILRHILPLGSIHGDRILACQATNEKGSPSSWIPPSKPAFAIWQCALGSYLTIYSGSSTDDDDEQCMI